MQDLQWSYSDWNRPSGAKYLMRIGIVYPQYIRKRLSGLWQFFVVLFFVPFSFHARHTFAQAPSWQPQRTWLQTSAGGTQCGMVGRKEHASRPEQTLNCRHKEKETLPLVHYIRDSLTVTDTVDIILYFVPIGPSHMRLMNLMAEEMNFSLNIND